MTADHSIIHAAFDVAAAAAEQAGRTIVDIRERDVLDVSQKGARNLLTAADLAAERLIRSAILDTFPGHAILAEECSPDYRGPALLKGPLWIIDPVDGTTNYARGLHSVSVSIAFAIDGVVRAGVVHAPFLRETFTAIQGQGARLNGRIITHASTDSLANALVVTGFPYERTDTALLTARSKAILDSCMDLRRLGSAALDLCNVACGRLDMYYETVSPWDMAAGALIAREAGVRVGQIRESSFDPLFPSDLQSRELLAAVPAIYDAAQRLLSSIA